MKKINSIYWCLLFTQAIACMKIPAHSSDNEFTIKIFTKKKSAGNPSVSGRIDELYLDGSYRPVMLAYISADNQGTKSTTKGYYSLDVIPGKHAISVRCVGYQPVVIKRVQIGQADSMRIDFHLVADTAKL